MLNSGWFFARPQEENLVLKGFQAADVPICASDADLAKSAQPVRLPQCERPKTIN